MHGCRDLTQLNKQNLYIYILLVRGMTFPLQAKKIINA